MSVHPVGIRPFPAPKPLTRHRMPQFSAARENLQPRQGVRPWLRLAVLALALLGGGDQAVRSGKEGATALHTATEQAVQETAVRQAKKEVRLPEGWEVLKPYNVPEDVIRRAAQTTLRIVNEPVSGDRNNYGSGFFFEDEDGALHIITNEHVMNPANRRIMEWTPGHGFFMVPDEEAVLMNSAIRTTRIYPYETGRVFMGSVVRMDAERDLALLKLNGRFNPAQAVTAMKFRDTKAEPLQRGEPLMVIGHPNGQRRAKLLLGHFFMEEGHRKQPLIMFEADCVPGVSGSAVFDLKGRLVGVVRLGSRPVGWCWAVPVAQVADWLAEGSDQKEEDPG